MSILIALVGLAIISATVYFFWIILQTIILQIQLLNHGRREAKAKDRARRDLEGK